MDASLIFAQSMSGLSRGMMLFLIASGLSLIFGVMNILNFAHATFWLIGAYFCYTFWYLMQDYNVAIWISIPLAALTLAAIGWVIEVVLIRRVYNRDLPEQLLLTYAMVLVLGDLIKIVWGVDDKLIERPPLVENPVFIFGMPFDSYFIFVILVGLTVAIGLWWFLKKTRYGHIIRAAVFSREMVSALGIPIPRIYTGVFALGIFIAGLAGAFRPRWDPLHWEWIWLLSFKRFVLWSSGDSEAFWAPLWQPSLWGKYMPFQSFSGPRAPWFSSLSSRHLY